MEIDLKEMMPKYLPEQVREDLHLKEILDVGEVEKIVLHAMGMMQDILTETIEESTILAICECTNNITPDSLRQGRCTNCQREMLIQVTLPHPLKGVV